MKSLVISRSININGHKTSISLEEAFWSALKDIAHERGKTLSHLVGSIDAKHQFSNLYHRPFGCLCLSTIAISTSAEFRSFPMPNSILLVRQRRLDLDQLCGIPSLHSGFQASCKVAAEGAANPNQTSPLTGRCRLDILRCSPWLAGTRLRLREPSQLAFAGFRIDCAGALEPSWNWFLMHPRHFSAQ